MDDRIVEAAKNLSRANKGVLLAMGALFVASLNATKATQQLGELLKEEL